MTLLDYDSLYFKRAREELTSWLIDNVYEAKNSTELLI